MSYKCLNGAGDAYNMAQFMAQYRGGLLGGFLRGLSIFAFFFFTGYLVLVFPLCKGRSCASHEELKCVHSIDQLERDLS